MIPLSIPGSAVLIMTDEPQLRRDLLRSLADSGYSVLEAASLSTERGDDSSLPRVPLLPGFPEAPSLRTEKGAVIMIVSKESCGHPAAGAGTRANTPGKREFRFGPLVIDFNRRQVRIADRPVRLTKSEYAFLCVLAERAGEVVSQRQIVRKLWGGDYYGKAVSVRVFACSLRKKLRNSFLSDLILTEPGFGYRLVDAEPIQG